MFCVGIIGRLRHAFGGSAATITAALLLGLSSSSIHAATTEPEFLLVDGAQDVQEKQLGDGRWGIIYTIDLPYPSRAIGKPQWDQLKAAGWTRCRGGNPDWVTFEDQSVASAGLVRQYVTHWFRGSRTITIGLRYYSWEPERMDRVMPINSVQFVDITFDDDPKHRDRVMWLAMGCS